MKKFLIIFLFLISFFSFDVKALDYPDINSKYVEVYDLTDSKILYEKNSNNRVSIASLTKIATTITAIESISNLDEKVKITSKILNTVSSDASVAGLKNGDIVTYRDLLYASMLPSGADATNSIAILSSGDISSFVKKMNKLAQKIGLNNTNFVNVTGLDDNNHYSTADDCRKLLDYALKNPLFREIYTTREYTLTNGLVVKSTLFKYSNSSVDISRILGSKTGYTGNAGYCLSSLSNIHNHDLIIIVLYAQHKGLSYFNINDTVKLIDFINNNYNNQILVKKGELIKTIPVEFSKIRSYNIHSSKEITKFLPVDYNKESFKIKYSGLKKLSFYNKVGTKIGSIKYYYEDKLIFTQQIKLEKKIKIDLLKIIKKYYYVFIFSFVFLLVLFKMFFSVIKKFKNKR